MFSVACVLSGQLRMSVKRWDTDNVVLFRMFSANGYQLMSDEQDVSPYLHFPGIFYCSCNCMCWVACRRSATRVLLEWIVNECWPKSDNVGDEFLYVPRTGIAGVFCFVISDMNSQAVSAWNAPHSVPECLCIAQRCMRSCCEFRSVYTNYQRLQEHSTQLRQKLTNDCAHAMGMGMSRRLTPPTFSS